MRALLKIRLRTLGWLILPLSVLILVPRLLLRRDTPGSSEWRWGWWQWLGLWVVVNGVGLAAWCVNLFNVEGRGTPLPLDPPKRFVITGPYRYVRNPMMLGAFLILVGEVVIFTSWSLFLYVVVLMVLAYVFVRFWEEPELVHRFGQAYLEYRRQVPRWIPRWPTGGGGKTA
jgi:protein-S-isoprenylcysteine O-methyltransferase Ste14